MMPRKPAAALIALLLALCLVACGGGGGGSGKSSGSAAKPPTPPTPPPSGSSMSDAERNLALEVLDIVNAERNAAGAPPLEWHEGAAEVAYLHSLDMDVRDFFDHTNPDGELPWDRLTAAGIAWSQVGENIAYGYPTPAAVMDGWMNSPGHRANILNGNYTHLGIGVHDNGLTIWWTQVFLVPR
ncbi:MAG: CAP domain-containing protein [Planctomycetota bacterium]